MGDGIVSFEGMKGIPQVLPYPLWAGVGEESLCGEDISLMLLAGAPSRSSLPPASRASPPGKPKPFSAHPFRGPISKGFDMELVPFFEARAYEQ